MKNLMRLVETYNCISMVLLLPYEGHGIPRNQRDQRLCGMGRPRRSSKSQCYSGTLIPYNQIKRRYEPYNPDWADSGWRTRSSSTGYLHLAIQFLILNWVMINQTQPWHHKQRLQGSADQRRNILPKTQVERNQIEGILGVSRCLRYLVLIVRSRVEPQGQMGRLPWRLWLCLPLENGPWRRTTPVSRRILQTHENLLPKHLRPQIFHQGHPKSEGRRIGQVSQRNRSKFNMM